MLPFFRNSSKRLFTIAALIPAVILLSGSLKNGCCEKEFFNDRRAVVIIDPGHGGAETGITGPLGLNEKDIALNMAQLLKTVLNDLYTVRLTRTGDYNVDIYERGSLANKEKGDLFISLHIGSCPRNGDQDITLFLYSNQSVVRDIDDENTMENGNPWSKVQLHHKTDGKKAAFLVKQALGESNPQVFVSLQHAPIALLKGIDMPSMLVEIGCLSSHSGEKKLRDNKLMSQYMTAIAHGIDRFLKK